MLIETIKKQNEIVKSLAENITELQEINIQMYDEITEELNKIKKRLVAND